VALPARDGKGHKTLDAPDFNARVEDFSGVHGMNVLLDTHAFLWFWWDATEGTTTNDAN
jgi:hypothetical protein